MLERSDPLPIRPAAVRALFLATCLLGLFLSNSASPVAAQVSPRTGTLTGTVLDGETGEPLFAANVLFTYLRDPSTQYARLTNESGHFKIDGLPTGLYEIRASFVGFRTRVADAIEVKAGHTIDVTLDLAVEPIAMKKVVITASRRKEMVLDAPAAVRVLGGTEVRRKEVLTPADHLQAQPSVDVVRSGLTQSNVVLRGFNNVFSGTTLLLVDNRIARVPSLRYNAWNLIPTTNEDVSRIELVSGPGSALYGPNSANGVVHLITRSPFASEGTTVSFAGGDQDVFTGSIRHAGSANDRVGWKVTSRWFQGTDFEHVDDEEDPRQAADDATTEEVARIGLRDFDAKKVSVEGRLDMRTGDRTQFIVNGGFNRVDSIELTGLGAVQTLDYAGMYGQARANVGNFFGQVYMNRSDAGDSYNLRTGKLFKDQSTLLVSQAQYQWFANEYQTFTYGADALFTRPDTEGTINGRNEDDDDINEVGVYMQSDTQISNEWSVVGAARLDNHNRIDEAVFSPRAALVYGPTENHKFRATYNRAFSTPTTNNLFLDLLTAGDVGGIGAATGTGGYDLRARGVPEGGFRFRRDRDGGVGGLYMQSPFTQPDFGGPARFIPAEATQMWDVALGSLQAAGIPSSILATIGTPTPEQVGTALATLNPTTGLPEPISPSEVRDVGEIQPTITNTLEVGYKGTFAESFSASIDVHHSRIKDFVGPLRVETPWVFFDPDDFAAFVGPAAPQIVAHYMGQGLSAAEAQAKTAELLAKIGSTPVGAVTPEGTPDPADLILTYRNFGDVELTGFDVGLEWAIARQWTIGGTYGYVDSDYFENVEGELDLALNAPRHKAGGTLQFADEPHGVAAGARVRFVDGFPVQSGVYVGEVYFYTLLDVNASWRIPGLPTTVLSAQVINVLDDRHREFVGVPELGRVGLARLTHSF